MYVALYLKSICVLRYKAMKRVMSKANHVEKVPGAICVQDIIPRGEIDDDVHIARNVPQRCGWASPFRPQRLPH